MIHLESGKRIVADVVLFTIGRIGAARGLHLEKAGLTPDDRGRLVVNGTFQTGVPHILGGGRDRLSSLAATSSGQGRLAACFAFGVESPRMAAHFPVGIYAIPRIRWLGPQEPS